MPGLREISYQQLSRSFHASKTRIAEELTLELTYRCNLSCLHCYCDCPSLRKKKELSCSRFKRIIDEAVQCGCLWLAFTGGEPLVRKDFTALYRYAKSKGCIISVLTNATLINDEVADMFEEWPPRQIEISLYGISGQTYEAVTRVPGSFRKCMRGIRLLAERGIPLEIKTVALTVNAHEIQAISDYAASIGASFRYDPLIHARYDGDTSPSKFRMPAARICRIEEQLDGMQDYWKRICRRYGRILPDEDRLFTCGGGRCSCTVNPWGRMQVCSMPGKDSYDLKTGSFAHGWNEFIPGLIGRKRIRPRPKQCRDCVMSAVCSQCPPWAYLETGDEEKMVGYICDLFTERARWIKQEREVIDDNAQKV
jgi:MoaA/NifB/PqqE/SkfB family radical SAM enzyme